MTCVLIPGDLACAVATSDVGVPVYNATNGDACGTVSNGQLCFVVSVDVPTRYVFIVSARGTMGWALEQRFLLLGAG